MRLLCIDPSIKAMGWAVFVDDVTRELVACGVVKVTAEMIDDHIEEVDYEDFEPDWIVAADVALNEMVQLTLDHTKPDLVLIEMPWVRGGRVGAAAGNTGAILKLMALVFQLRAVYSQWDLDVTLVPVPKWKGNVPKEITQSRARKYWGWRGEDHNEGDAVGIGDWYFRKYLK